MVLLLSRQTSRSVCRLEKNALDRRSRADRPRYHARYSALLPLASAASRRTPRHASAQLITYYYAAVSQYSALTLDLDIWPWHSIPGELGSLTTHILTQTHTPRFKGQSVQKIEWKQIDRRTDRWTDGRCQLLLPSRLTRSVTIVIVGFQCSDCTYANRQNTSTVWRACSFPCYVVTDHFVIHVMQSVTCLCVCVLGRQLSNKMALKVRFFHSKLISR